jgi:hypothetical protein
MAHHEPVSVDPREIEHSKALWHNFTQLMKWTVIGTAVLLAVMAAVFVDW